jgi:hypothetical protein
MFVGGLCLIILGGCFFVASDETLGEKNKISVFSSFLFYTFFIIKSFFEFFSLQEEFSFVRII